MTNIVTNLPPEILNDIVKVCTDLGLHVTASGVVQFLVTLFVLARLLRKAIPDNWQTGVIGTALKHTALEVNPDKPTVNVQQTLTNQPKVQ